MSDDLSSLWEQAKPVEDLAAAWEQAKPPAKSSVLGDVADVASREIVKPIGAAFTGLAHGISSGSGPISRLVRSSLLFPGEKEELDAMYAAEPNGAKKVGDFVGSAYTPENAAIGQAVGSGLGAVGKTVAGPVGRWLESKGLAQGKRVLMGGADPLAVKNPVSDTAARAAFDVGAITPGGTVQHAADVLKTARAATGDEVGAILDQLEAAGVKGPDALALARTLRQKAADLEANSVATGAPELYRKIADELESKLPAFSPAGPAEPNIGLKPAESIKRSLQEKAKYDRVQGDKIIEGARKDIASTVRQSVEDAVAAQSNLAPGPAAAFVPTKEKLAAYIEASNAANKGAAQAARRNAFSLRDMILGSGASAAGAAAAGPLGTLAGPATTIASHLARTRGTPTVAWGAYNLGRALEGVAAGPASGSVSKAGPVIASQAPNWIESLGLRAGMAPAAAEPATPTGSASPAPAGSGSPNASSNVTGSQEDPAEHFKRWMTDRGYREGK